MALVISHFEAVIRQLQLRTASIIFWLCIQNIIVNAFWHYDNFRRTVAVSIFAHVEGEHGGKRKKD